MWCKKVGCGDIFTFTKKVDLITPESNVKELDIKNLKNVITCFNNLKTNVDKLDITKYKLFLLIWGDIMIL